MAPYGPRPISYYRHAEQAKSPVSVDSVAVPAESLRSLDQTAAVTVALCHLAESANLYFIAQLLRLAQKELGSNAGAVQTVTSGVGFSH